MKNLHPVSPSRIAVMLAITAGLLTGALMQSDPLGKSPHLHGMANQQIDPSMPALIIVAKKLSPAEKQRLAADDQVAGEVDTMSAGQRPESGETESRRF